MPISKIDLAEMLEARERRCRLQQELITAYGKPLVCLTMNIAGPVKRTPLIRLLFDYGLNRFEANRYPILEKRIIDSPTGCEAFYAVDGDPRVLKESVCSIEESFPAARLFDFDVLDPHGEKLSREHARACLVCGGPVQVCSRSRAHGLDAIIARTDTLLEEFATDYYAKAAVAALIREVHTTPKPGLVDENNSGAHPDMDLPLFEKSANALMPYFNAAVLQGLHQSSMLTLREEGKQAEKAMFAATAGINTHKGAIYSFVLLLYAIGYALKTGQDVFETVPMLLASEQSPGDNLQPSHGDRVRSHYGKIGAMEEAKAGFPSARFAAQRLAFYTKQSVKNPEALTLCDLLACVEDTNLYHRGGAEGARYAQTEARRISCLPTEKRIPELERLDSAMIEKNLSPGGCADLLALSFLIDQWNRESAGLFV